MDCEVNSEMDVSKLSYEEAFAELETIVKGINSGDQKLDWVVKSLKRAFALATYCQDKLNSARFEIKNMTEEFEKQSSSGS